LTADVEYARRGPARADSFWVPACGLAAFALLLRARAMFTDFWLDEIWSYDLARRARSVADIFFSPDLKHDNNHQLNTLWLYVLGDQPHWVLYRIPALVAGVVAVVVAYAAGRERSRAEGWFAGLGVAVSFTMVVYSTEARGYALVLLFALLALVALRRYLDTPSLAGAARFWIWIVLGLAAQASILHFYLGAMLWSGYRLRGRSRDLLLLHGVPVAWGGLWAALVLLGSRIGGGPAWTWRSIGDQSLAWTFGYPVSIVPAWLAAGAASALVVWDARRLWRAGSDAGLFFVGAIFGPPIIVAALSPPWLFPRYFLVSLLFLLLVAARSLARLWCRPGWGRPMAGSVFLLFVVGNARHIVPFSEYGRGLASQAIRAMASSRPSGEIFVTGRPVDLWSSLPVAYYEHAFGLGNRLHYVPAADLEKPGPPAPVDWLVVQGQTNDVAPGATVSVTGAGRFVLQHAYPQYGPSGMRWWLYRREP
jgi:hypothetical protein